MIDNLVKRLRAHYEAMLGPDYLQAADALEAQEANAKQLADTIRDMHAAGLELRQRAEQAERTLAEAVELIDQLSSFQISETLEKTGKLSDLCKAWIEHKKFARQFVKEHSANADQ